MFEVCFRRAFSEKSPEKFIWRRLKMLRTIGWAHRLFTHLLRSWKFCFKWSVINKAGVQLDDDVASSERHLINKNIFRSQITSNALSGQHFTIRASLVQQCTKIKGSLLQVGLTWGCTKYAFSLFSVTHEVVSWAGCFFNPNHCRTCLRLGYRTRESIWFRTLTAGTLYIRLCETRFFDYFWRRISHPSQFYDATMGKNRPAFAWLVAQAQTRTISKTVCIYRISVRLAGVKKLAFEWLFLKLGKC